MTRQKGRKLLTPSGRLENVLSGRQLGSFLHTHATKDHETTWEEMEDARKSRPEQESPSVPKVKTQTDVKSLNSLKASPATTAENSLSMVDKMKHIVV